MLIYSQIQGHLRKKGAVVMKIRWLRGFAIGVAMSLLCSCGHYGDKSVGNRPEPKLHAEDYQVEQFDTSLQQGYTWFFCADERFYYTSGVQELMDDASRPVPLYAYDPSSGISEEIPLPLGEEWHLYSMTPAPDGGYWMVFTPLTFGNSVTDYTPKGAWLLKTDAEFQELFRIDLSPYSQELVRIVNVICPKSSQYAVDAKESMGWAKTNKNEFFKPELLCDSRGRVYVAAVLENVLVFEPDGTLLQQFDIFDEAYAQGVCLSRTAQGDIAVSCAGANDYEIYVIDTEAMSIGAPFVRRTEGEYTDRLAPVSSLLPEYDLFGCGYYGLYGISLGPDGTYSSRPLLYYGENNKLPQDENAIRRHTSSADQLAFLHLGQAEEDGSKVLSLYTLTMK